MITSITEFDLTYISSMFDTAVLMNSNECYIKTLLIEDNDDFVWTIKMPYKSISYKKYTKHLFRNFTIHQRLNGTISYIKYKGGELQSVARLNIYHQLHNTKGPALQRENKKSGWSTTDWCINGKLHRRNLPAMINIWSGREERYYFLHGLRHREGDLPAVEDVLGKKYFLFDMVHRETGPAIEDANGVKVWFYCDRHIMQTKGEVTPEQIKRFKTLIKLSETN